MPERPDSIKSEVISSRTNSAGVISRGAYRFAVLTASVTAVLLMAGALVTSNDAADSVPDWPLSCGLSIGKSSCLIPPMIGGIRFEYTHRLIAAAVSILTLILAVWIARTEKRPLARKLGWTALGLVIAQAILGGIRVLEGHPAITATAHAVLAQIFFITLVGLALYLSPWWQRDLPQLDDNAPPTARGVTLWTTIVIFCQLILGAAFRHGAFGLTPHLIGAGVVTVMVVLAGRVVKKRFGKVPELRRGVVYLHAFFGIQIVLGGLAWWAINATADYAQPTPLYVIPTVAHVLGGALTLAASLLLTLKCYRLIRPAIAVTAGSTQGVRA
ncbi:MAG TPA: COX15/CtaA family protein [Candidatus Aquilonibacter sp.]|nr:COX15/CtaA family protein [Candidatus Aquilonibacter sp.]